MSTAETRYEHIVLDEAGTAMIAGTTMKVIELVSEQSAHGWSPEELHFQHPYLSLGQIHSALAFYWDHRAVLDQDIARRRARAQDLRRKTPSAPLIARIKRQS